MSLFEELKRRNVFRVSIGYIITAWLLLQVVDLVLENVNAPDWVMQVFMLALAIGFPLAVFFAWAFEMTPDGVKRESEVDRSQSITAKTGHKMNRNIIIVMALALAYFAYDKFWGSTANSPAQSTPVEVVDAGTEAKPANASAKNPEEQSVAVLPFVNMSDDKQNEYFSDGISEELLNVLVKVKGLRVPSRTSSFTFKDSTMKLADIGRELQVDHILEGSVRKSGDRIRVTAQLIEVSTDTHLWSDTYTRQLDDIFAVQDEIAQAIVSALKLTLSVDEQASLSNRSTSDVEAYNNYLLGRHQWNQRSPESILAATGPLKKAIEIDPRFDQAWAALADAYVLMPEYGTGTIQEHIPLARDAIEKALAINPQSARALTTSAYIKFMYQYDIEGAQADFEKAITIEPGYATAHQWYGELLAADLRLEESLEQFRLARLADPLAPIMPHDMGWILMYAGMRDEAYIQFDEALTLHPHFKRSLRNLVMLNIMTGRFDQARERSRELGDLTNYDTALILAVIKAVENPAPELQQQALTLLAQTDKVPDGAAGRARYLMLLNEPELALENLEKAFAAGDPYAIHINRMDIFDPIRDNPRFQALLTKMNQWP